MVTIAAVVCTLPTPVRQPLLFEAIRSVYDQTRPPDDMVIGLDYSRLGEVANLNRLIAATDCEWLAFLHDDDVWLPEHLEVCERHMADADVVVSRFELVGRPWSTIEPWHDNFDDLRSTNWIGSPSMVCVRASTFGQWVEPGGYGTEWVDLTNWRRLLDKGARFVDTRQKTTLYRFGEWTNGSWKAPC
jgi:hypothetical protein